MAGTKNSGRKSRAEELMTSKLAGEAITKKYGSLQGGLIAALESGEPSLVKFVYEHAFGKPREKQDIDVNSNIETLQIIQLPDNGRGNSAQELPE